MLYINNNHSIKKKYHK